MRSSLSLDVRDFTQRTSRRRSESLDPPENRASLTSFSQPQNQSPHFQHRRNHHHRRNLSMEPQELSRDLAAAVDELSLISFAKKKYAKKELPPDPAHDYAEIYTPSREKQPIWTKDCQPESDVSSTFTNDSAIDGRNSAMRAPTPPLHRFPSWEAKIYQVANDGLATGENCSPQDQDESVDSLENGGGDATDGGSRGQRTASGGYCDINVPVYATVKGVSAMKLWKTLRFYLLLIFSTIRIKQRASQIRTMPFSDSSDDSSDGEEHVAMATCTASTINSHNSSSTDNTESNTSGSASSPSKSVKTSSSLSPAKRSADSDSPKNKGRGMFRCQRFERRMAACNVYDFQINLICL